jgi:hypothetical protein
MTQLERDLSDWSDQRLKQWFIDSIDRYEMVDIDERKALANTTAILMTMLAQVLSLIEVTPEEAAYKLLETIKFCRDRTGRRSNR